MQCPVCGKNETSPEFKDVICPPCARVVGVIDEESLNRLVKFWIRTGTQFQAQMANKQNQIRNAGKDSIAPAYNLTMFMAPTFDVQNARRMLYQQRLYDSIKNVDGDIVEFGVGVGGTFINWCTLVYDSMDKRQIWGFDSFEGFPEPTPEDYGMQGDMDAWKSTGTDTLRLLLDVYNLFGLDPAFFNRHVTIVKGFFSDTVEEYEKRGRGKIALLHLDCDLYESYRITLEKCAPLVEPLGVIALDEYINTRERMNYPGAYRAIDEFLKKNHDYKLCRDERFGKYYLRKLLI